MRRCWRTAPRRAGSRVLVRAEVEEVPSVAAGPGAGAWDCSRRSRPVTVSRIADELWRVPLRLGFRIGIRGI